MTVVQVTMATLAILGITQEFSSSGYLHHFLKGDTAGPNLDLKEEEEFGCQMTEVLHVTNLRKSAHGLLPQTQAYFVSIQQYRAIKVRYLTQ